MPRVLDGLYAAPDPQGDRYRWAVLVPDTDPDGNPRELEVRLSNVDRLPEEVVITLYVNEALGEVAPGIRLNKDRLQDLRDGIDFMLPIIQREGSQ